MGRTQESELIEVGWKSNTTMSNNLNDANETSKLSKDNSWYEYKDGTTNLGCRKSPNSDVEVNYSHSCMKLNLWHD